MFVNIIHRFGYIKIEENDIAVQAYFHEESFVRSGLDMIFLNENDVKLKFYVFK